MTKLLQILEQASKNRPLNVGAVAAATIRQTPGYEYEKRVGKLRAQLAQMRDFQAVNA